MVLGKQEHVITHQSSYIAEPSFYPMQAVAKPSEPIAYQPSPFNSSCILLPHESTDPRPDQCCSLGFLAYLQMQSPNRTFRTLQLLSYL